jgi:opacity protein-like surface antigen
MSRRANRSSLGTDLDAPSATFDRENFVSGPLRIGAFAVILAVSALSANAQSNATHFNLAAGLTLPTGTFSDRNDAGYNIIVGLGVKQRGSALGFRAEGIYNEFNEHGTNDKSHAGGVTANAIYDLATNSRNKTSSLFIIGGVGYYSTREPFFSSESQTNIGWNVGGGFEFPLSGFSAYIEARYHTVSNTDVRFVPISFGLVF